MIKPRREIRELAATWRAKREQLRVQLAEALADFDEKPSCGRGCAHCCAQMVTPTILDGLLIALALLEKPEALARFREGFAAEVDRLTRVRGLRSIPYFHESKPCLLLHNRECSVYSVRPADCEAWLVASPPELCAPSEAGDDGFIRLGGSRFEQATAILAVAFLSSLGFDYVYAAPLAISVFWGFLLIENGIKRGKNIIEGTPADRVFHPLYWERQFRDWEFGEKAEIESRSLIRLRRSRTQ